MTTQTKYDASVTYIRSVVLRKLSTLSAGQTFEYERTQLGGILEEFISYNGFGHKLTDMITEACADLPNVTVLGSTDTPDGKVRVVINV